jgi:hypothetical protein
VAGAVGDAADAAAGAAGTAVGAAVMVRVVALRDIGAGEAGPGRFRSQRHRHAFEAPCFKLHGIP